MQKLENRTPATQNAITTKCEGVDTYHSKKTALITKSMSVKVTHSARPAASHEIKCKKEKKLINSSSLTPTKNKTKSV